MAYLSWYHQNNVQNEHINDHFMDLFKGNICLEDSRLENLSLDKYHFISCVMMEEKFKEIIDKEMGVMPSMDESEIEWSLKWNEFRDLSIIPLINYRKNIMELFCSEKWFSFNVEQKRLINESLHNKLMLEIQEQQL